ncbi:major facilitator superfamily domain-containing protein [Mycena galericulata]|nr:major facilitator superfamily domain-containing protein [Mycena galericulata]
MRRIDLVNRIINHRPDVAEFGYLKGACKANSLFSSFDTRHPPSTDSVSKVSFMIQNAPSAEPTSNVPRRKGRAFWMVLVALMVSVFLSALDVTVVSIALPTIASNLHGGSDYVWVVSSYTLSSTAILPLSGRLADVFGRRAIVLLSIVLFAAGSAISGAAQNMNMLIAGRTIQGLGGGGVSNLAHIVIADLVPLSERGLYQSFIGVVWAFASAIGPPLGGVLAQKSWRWIFFLNIPLTVIAFVLSYFFLRVKTPPGSVRDKLMRLDWIGNCLAIVGTTLAILGLTWAGTYPWISTHVLGTLIPGVLILVLFFFYEARFPKEPTIPFDILANRTSAFGYVGSMLQGVTSVSIIYFLPIYLQACHSLSPLRSSMYGLPTSLLISPCGVLGSVLVAKTKRYKPANLIGWALVATGFGIMSMLRADSSIAVTRVPSRSCRRDRRNGERRLLFSSPRDLTILLQFAVTLFPVLAPLPVERNAAAVAFCTFCMTFAQTWGITISSTIIQNRLTKTLPAGLSTQSSQGNSAAYALIPSIHLLEEPLRTEVRVAFASSMQTLWQVMIGIAGVGFLSALFLEEVVMGSEQDAVYGIDERRDARNAVSSAGSSYQLVPI